MTLPLRFGYKASAEQFAPTELLNYAVLARGDDFGRGAPSASPTSPSSL